MRRHYALAPGLAILAVLLLPLTACGADSASEARTLSVAEIKQAFARHNVPIVEGLGVPAGSPATAFLEPERATGDERWTLEVVVFKDPDTAAEYVADRNKLLALSGSVDKDIDVAHASNVIAIVEGPNGPNEDVDAAIDDLRTIAE